MDSKDIILDVENLSTTFISDRKKIRIVKNVSFQLKRGSALAVVGESGCGKSVTMNSIMRFLGRNAIIEADKIQYNALRDGKVTEYRLEQIDKPHGPEMRALRGPEMSMVFQDPMSSLNPVYKVGDQVAEGLLQHNKGMTKAQAREKVLEMFRKLGIPDPEERIDCYPHQFSGGMKQRVVIAIAMICNPELIICDEPTTALDVTIQAQIMELLKEMQTKDGKSIILITHNMGLVAEMADEVCVMYMGRVVEFGSLEDVFDRTSHPYTQALLRSVPVLGLADGQKLETIPGATPNPADLKGGCEFADRCPFATDACREKDIPMFQLSPGHRVRCLKYKDYPVAEGGEAQAEVAEVQ
ncbi:ABC transporter ATP-binding protein [Pseudoflavonifractor sp. HCP28S3_F10]|uniref:ABC transporter ATP-binding protein n=1 Tax=Pseudoflavonifractor sp. HCP28S3_F10 TaxID=3438947 RepID=UPI003F8A82E6